MQRIDRRRPDNNGCAVLIVVEYGDVHARTANPFNDETIGCLDVFEVDRAKGRLQRADDLGELFGVGFVHLDVETVDMGEFLEEHGLALHHRLGGQRANVSKTQNGGAVGHHRNQIAARGETARTLRIGLDFETGLGDAGAVGARKVAPVRHRLGGADFQFAGLRKLVVIERRLPQRIPVAVRHVHPPCR
jgi:hypothetical protein